MTRLLGALTTYGMRSAAQHQALRAPGGAELSKLGVVSMLGSGPAAWLGTDGEVAALGGASHVEHCEAGMG